MNEELKKELENTIGQFENLEKSEDLLMVMFERAYLQGRLDEANKIIGSGQRI